MNIFTIGDSHANKGWILVSIPNVKIHPTYLGPKLMFSFDKSMIKLEDFPIEPNDCIVFCFGEIDVRCHVYNHTKEGDFHSVIVHIVEKYFDSILMCIDCIKDRKVKICIYFIPPTPRVDTAIKNPNYPFMGTDEERKQYVLYMNSLLRQGCEKNDFTFINLYEDYCDSDGFLNSEMSDGHVHIQDVKPLVDFIEKELL